MYFFYYTFHPAVCKASKPTIWDILKIFLIYVVILLITTPFFLFIQKKIGCQTIPIENSITFLYFVIIAPIIEEILFRLPLRFSKRNYYILFVTLLAYLAFLVIKTKIVFFVLFLLYFLLLIFIRSYPKKDIHTLYHRYFKYIYWLSILGFGFLHLNNHPTVWYNMILFAPILCFPQILLGSIAGYLRMRYGFIYGVMFHIANNLPLYLLYYHFH